MQPAGRKETPVAKEPFVQLGRNQFWGIGFHLAAFQSESVNVRLCVSERKSNPFFFLFSLWQTTVSLAMLAAELAGHWTDDGASLDDPFSAVSS